MNEPTPEPWAISQAEIPEFYTDEWYVNDCLNIESVAIVNGEANARLIAAAPEMLEALEELAASRWQDMIGPRARAALAKAKGEA